MAGRIRRGRAERSPKSRITQLNEFCQQKSDVSERSLDRYGFAVFAPNSSERVTYLADGYVGFDGSKDVREGIFGAGSDFFDRVQGVCSGVGITFCTDCLGAGDLFAFYSFIDA